MNVYDLWLPIVLTGIACHVLSTLAWMVLPHHKPEWKKLDCEDEFHAFLVDKNILSGQYIFPFAKTPEEMKSKAHKAKDGKCRGMLVMWDSPTNMGAAIGQTLGFFLLVAFVIGYVASLGLDAGESFMQVFQFVTTVGLLTHLAAKFPNGFWFRRKVAMDLLDGVAFAIATGLVFALLWPSA